MAFDEVQINLASLAEWIDDCQQRGWVVPEAILSDRERCVRDHCGPRYCASCGIPVMYEEYWTGKDCQVPLGHPTHDWEYLCESCNEGEDGHHEYHHNIEQTERERHFYVGQQPRHERRSSHEAFERIAEDEHLACPWAARGEPCEKVEAIKFSREEEELCRREAEQDWDDSEGEDAEPGAAADPPRHIGSGDV